MPRVKSNLFNYISGKSGNVVFRQMNGKTFYSVRPDSYNISQSAKAKATRSNFSLAVKFARKINEQAILKQVWNKAKTKGTTSYHRIIKYNAGFIRDNKLSVSNCITPEGEPFPITNYIISDDEIILEFDITTLDNSSFCKYSFSIITIVSLYDRKKKSIEDNFLINFIEEYKKINTGSEDKLTISLPKDIRNILPKYKNCIVYLAAVFNQEETGKLKWTSTVPINFPIPV